MVANLAIDTNAYRALTDGSPQICEALEAAATVLVPYVVLAELRAGFRAGTRTLQNETVLGRFLRKPGVRTIWADADTIEHYAGIYQQLRQQGTPIPTNDLWIAAVVIQHHATLLTGDRHFENLPQLARIAF